MIHILIYFICGVMTVGIGNFLYIQIKLSTKTDSNNVIIIIILLGENGNTIINKENAMYEKNRLLLIMDTKRISYRELSRLSGVSTAALNEIANFQEDPKQSTMIAIARALEMEVIEVFDLNWRK